MSSPNMLGSGALTTNGIVASGSGLMGGVQIFGGALAVYDGLSTSGTPQIATMTSGSESWSGGIKYGTGLYVTISAGTAVVQANNFSTST